VAFLSVVVSSAVLTISDDRPEARVFVVDLVSSPGAGKTALLEKTPAELAGCSRAAGRRY
jgi:Ni2+-binding GTPase involved in maturation of urease and hydrogenase